MMMQQGSDGMFMIVLGLIAVFIVLMVINKSRGKPSEQTQPQEAPAVSEVLTPAAPAQDPGELAAVIAAAIAAAGMRGGSPSRLPLTVAPYVTSPSWSAVSRNENTQKL